MTFTTALVRAGSQHAPIDTALRFTDGLVVYPENCERAIHARRHWRAGPDGTAVCGCTPEPVRRDDWSLGYQAAAS